MRSFASSGVQEFGSQDHAVSKRRRREIRQPRAAALRRPGVNRPRAARAEGACEERPFARFTSRPILFLDSPSNVLTFRR